MSDLTLNRYLSSGTAAEMAAFTPTPPTPVSGPDHGYIWFQTDTGATYAWDGAAWALVASGGTPGDVSGPGASTDNAIVRWDGTGGDTVQNSVVTVSDAGAVAFPDDVRQTFNPGTTNAGLNVGAHAGVPGSLSNGDLFYDSSANALKARINGVTVALGSGTGDVVGPASAVDDRIATFDGTTGTLIQDGGSTIADVLATALAAAMSALAPSAFEWTFDGGGVALTTGVKLDFEIPFNCTLTAVRLGADVSGSVVFDLWKDTYANYPPTVADTITASAKPTLSSAITSADTTLTGWTTSCTAGDWLRINIDSVATITRVTMSLRYTRT